jgi:hypothetical protein
MPDMDKDRKKELRRAWEEQERDKLINSIPIPQCVLAELFVYLDREDAPSCDHSLRETILFLQERKLAVEPVVEWLRQHGGYCDCEVIFNVADKFGEIVDRQSSADRKRE